MKTSVQANMVQLRAALLHREHRDIVVDKDYAYFFCFIDVFGCIVAQIAYIVLFFWQSSHWCMKI